MSALALVALLLGACNKDKDDDGFKGDDDCDDDNDLVFPGAAEVCDGVDNDCDGEADEGLAFSLFADADGDGYGDENTEISACTDQDGYVEDDNDCDDANASIHPGAAETDCTDPVDYNCDGSTGYADADGDGAPACEDCDDTDDDRSPYFEEVCDGVDNNCDGGVDVQAVDLRVFHLDHDGDGYGDPDIWIEECEPPGDMWIDDDTDCDDLVASAYPGAPEICDEIDNDCDGIIDVEDPDIADALTLYTDADGDGYGAEGTDLFGCETALGYVDVAGDCDDGDEAVNPDAPEVCNDEEDNDCDGRYGGCTMDLDYADGILYGEGPENKAGASIAVLGDIDADGFDDFVVGAYSNDVDGDSSAEGAAYVVYGPLTSGAHNLGEYQKISGSADGQQAGYRVAGPGDMDGDGTNELAMVGSLYDGAGLDDTGGLFIFSGIGLGTVSMSVTEADAIYYADSKYDWLGGSLRPGMDIDGDGLDDLIVGATGEDMGGGNSGAVFILYGEASLDGQGSISDVAASLYGEKGQNVGKVVQGPGDLDSDGFADVLVGDKTESTGGTNAGLVYIVRGPIAGSQALDDADAVVIGSSAGDYLGDDLATIGDADSDGYDDVLMSATTEDSGAADGGAVYLVMGTATVSAWDGLDADSVMGAKIAGASKEIRFGRSVDGSGDTDGDRVNDLLVGSPSAGSSGRGMAWLFYGPISGTLTSDDAAASFEGTYNDDQAGSAVAFLGDLDGSGQDALGITAEDGSLGGVNAGAIYVILDIGL